MASHDGHPAIPDDPSQLPLVGHSALVGQPPATRHDYHIINGLLRMSGAADVSPMAGYTLSAKPPTDDVHETRVPGTLAGLVFVILAIVLPTVGRIALRSRRGSAMQFGWDDWTVMVAALLALAYPIAQITSLTVGAAGLHIWEVTYEQYNLNTIVAGACNTTFYVAVGLIKLSIAIFIRRIADRIDKSWRMACDVYMASLVLYVLVALFYSVFSCNPPAAQWDLALRGRLDSAPRCVNMGVQAKVLGGIHIAQGLTLLSTPVIIMWNIRMETAKKMHLLITWAVGGLTVLAGLLRQVRSTKTGDPTWDYVEVLVWTCLDLSLGIITASLPVLDGLIERYLSKAKGSIVESYGAGPSQVVTGSSTWQYSKTSDTERSRKHTQRASVTMITQMMDRSESRESIVKKDHLRENGGGGGLEMNILRTQEVEVHVSNAGEDPTMPVLDPRAPSPQWHNRPEWHEKPRNFKFKPPGG